jgi:hypothetical protein
MSDLSGSSIPIPDDAVEDLAFRHARKELWHPDARGVKRRWEQLSELVKNSWRRRARGDLEAVAPKLYEGWAEKLVALPRHTCELDHGTGYLPLASHEMEEMDKWERESEPTGGYVAVADLLAALGLGDRP